MSAPVLRACIPRSAAASSGADARHGRLEIDRLATNHACRAGRFGDDARRVASLRRASSPVSTREDSAGSRARSANASVSSPSPERMAMPSP